MLKASVVFFALGLLSVLLGWHSLGGLNFEIGRTLFFVFLALALLSFLVSLARRGSAPLILPPEPHQLP